MPDRSNNGNGINRPGSFYGARNVGFYAGDEVDRRSNAGSADFVLEDSGTGKIYWML